MSGDESINTQRATKESGGDRAVTAEQWRKSPTANAAAAARRIRGLIDSTSFPSENHRKAAIRLIIHESVTGLDEAEAVALVDALKERFPDRSFNASARAELLESQAASAKSRVSRLRGDRDAFRERAEALDTHFARLLQAVGGLQIAPSEETKSKEFDLAEFGPEALGRLVDALLLLLNFAIDQESSLESVDQAIRSGARSKPEIGLRQLVARIANGAGDSKGDLQRLDKTLRQIQLLPAALLAGVRQSWKAGTLGALEHLDPKACEENVPMKVPGLREAAILKECRSRFEAFWAQLDKNIDHYYRGALEKVYSQKMEDRT